MIAAVAAVARNSLVVIEEPELFLHPTLQRRLLRYLSRSIDNSYIMSTHSAHILDTEIASVVHVSKEDGWTHLLPATLPAAIAGIGKDLGYRPSDLLQANYVIWVEGPSDRVYLRAWISERDPSLLEGSHYSIMIYGGKLLNALAFDDPEVDQFINMNRIARSFAVLVDRDGPVGDESLNATKRRVISEVTGQGQVAWVTRGYTIENYVEPGSLQAAIDSVYPNRRIEVSASEDVNPLGALKNISKPLIAARVVAEAATGTSVWREGVLDEVVPLVQAIRDANGLPELPER